MSKTTVTPPAGKTPMDVICQKDGHRWTVAFLPMRLSTIGNVLRAARCPRCGASSRHIRVAID